MQHLIIISHLDVVIWSCSISTQEQQLQQHQATQTNPRMRVCGGRAFCPSDACAQSVDMSALFAPQIWQKSHFLNCLWSEINPKLETTNIYVFCFCLGRSVSPARFCAAKQWASGLQASVVSCCLLDLKLNQKKQNRIKQKKSSVNSVKKNNV